MHILLYERHRENKEIRNLLLNPVIMKAAYANTTGGEKTREKVSLVKEALKDDQLFKAIQKLVGVKTNSHNVSMLVRRVTGNYRSFWTKLKNGDKDARPPKAKRLKKANHFSLPLENGKWSLKKKNKIGLTLRNKQVLVDLPHEGILKEKGIENITGVSLVFSNGNLYLSFTYKKPELQKEIEKVRAKKTSKRLKTAGLDIGINNIFSIFVDDETTPSVVMSGAMYKHYNVRYNKFNAKISSDIDSEKDEGVKKYKRGLKWYSAEKRKLFFKSEWDKLSSAVVAFLKKAKVRQLVISKNLSFAKKDGDINMRKKDKQKFYIMPFARLLNLIEEKCLANGISVVVIDEAYTGKTSCLLGKVIENQSKRQKGEKPCANDFGGSRAGGIFKDFLMKIAFHSDINGAANHVIVGIGKLQTNLRDHLAKLCNPLKFKSANGFSDFLETWDADTGFIGSPTLQA